LAAEKSSEFWPMPEKAKLCGEHSEQDFFAHEKIRPGLKSNQRLDWES